MSYPEKEVEDVEAVLEEDDATTRAIVTPPYTHQTLPTCRLTSAWHCSCLGSIDLHKTILLLLSK